MMNAEEEPRLFQCSNAMGSFIVDEVFNWTQEDLIREDVMLMDASTVVFVWIGDGANEQEKREAMASAAKYIEAAAARDGRDEECPIVQISCGGEPKAFTSLFVGCDAARFESQAFMDPYEAKLAAMKAEKAKRDAEREAEEASSAVAAAAAAAAEQEKAAAEAEAAVADAAAQPDEEQV